MKTILVSAAVRRDGPCRRIVPAAASAGGLLLARFIRRIRLLCGGLLLVSAAVGNVVAGAEPASRVNVVLLIADDVSWNDLGCYGNAAARTPNIDALAADGLRFDRAFLTASSCSPSRSSIITGRYPHNTGPACELHQPISGHLPWFPEFLRAAGYYTALSGKNHMRSAAPKSGPRARPRAFDHIDSGRSPENSGGHAHWVRVLLNRPREKPFFCWFASYDAHRDWEADQEWDASQYGPPHRPQDVVVPPFLIDNEATRRDLASYYNEITRFDWFVGQVVDELRRQNVLDSTLLLILSDNGRPFPRAKTRLHDSGMRTPLIAHWPDGIARTGTVDALVSAVDLAPTILELAGCRIPAEVQGKSFASVLQSGRGQHRRYAFSEHNWHDYEAHGRSVRQGDFLLIRNHRPWLPWQGPADSVRSPSHQSLLETAPELLTEAQKDVLAVPRPETALYNTAVDPDQLHNLAECPESRDVLEELSAVLDQWMEETGDTVPLRLRPDAFDRRLGTRLSSPGESTRNWPYPGQDRAADRIFHPGPF